MWVYNIEAIGGQNNIIMIDQNFEQLCTWKNKFKRVWILCEYARVGRPHVSA